MQNAPVRNLAYGLLRYAAALAVALGVLYGMPAWALGQWIDEQSKPTLLTLQDRTWYRQAFQAAVRGEWPRALRLAENAKERLPEKALRWSYYRRHGNHATFAELKAFIEANPDWPRIRSIRYRAEEALDDSVGDATVLAWFESRQPVSGPGQIRLAEALLRSNRADEAIDWLRRAWVGHTFTKRQAKRIYREFGKYLRNEDHISRLDRLLWDGHRYSARRMLAVVPGDYRKVAEARLSLMVSGPGVDAKIAAISADLKSDPGLIYERLRWRRRKGLDDRARELLLPPPDDIGLRPDKWWIERRIQARKLLGDEKPGEAYRVVAPHGTEPGSIDFAEAEWLAGWIALRFLGRPDTGYRHFKALYDAVQYPVSLARASYWAGRAAEAADDADLAKRWLDVAAGYPNTYYGQLAIERRANGDVVDVWRLPPDHEPSDEDIRSFEKLELVRLVRMLHEVGANDWTGPFLRHLARTLPRPELRSLTPQLAEAIGRNDLAVSTAKAAMLTGVNAYRHGYPVLPVASNRVEPALVLALMRQESEFNPDAVSHAGARGLMQLMPSTARRVAKRIGAHYHRTRLTDPEYNMQLGTAYLADLIEDYDGSYIMALAAYNAGPSRVSRWIRQFGDPRQPGTNVVDWVESITLSETRNYVQRVMENLQIYRARLADGPTTLALLADLRRNSPDL